MPADQERARKVKSGWASGHQARDLQAVEGDGDQVRSTLKKLKKTPHIQTVRKWTEC